MKRSEYLLPWAVLWLPVVVVACILLTVGGVKVFKTKPPKLTSLLGPVPQTFLASLDGSFEELAPKTNVRLTEINPFAFREDKPPELPKQSVEQIPKPKEKVRVGAVFVVNGSKVCLLNGSPYREGSNILQKGVITGIDTNKVKVRVGDEERVVLVGEDFEI